MHIPVRLEIRETDRMNPTKISVFIEVEENTTKSEFIQKATERALEFTKIQPKSCTAFVNGKEMSDDWKKSNRDGRYEAKIVKQ